MKTITYQEAYSLYLKEGFDDIVPFEDTIEDDYVSFLRDRGFIIIEDCSTDSY